MIVTGANSDRFRRLAATLLPDAICLELSEGTTSLECDRERFELTGRWSETAEGIVIACEADVAVAGVYVPGDRITVEKGDRRLEADYPGRVYGWSPWAGFISCPAAWMPDLCRRVVRAMDVVVRDPCLALYWALESCGHPWELRRDSAFWPSKAAITHYRGAAAKREVCPQLF